MLEVELVYPEGFEAEGVKEGWLAFVEVGRVCMYMSVYLRYIWLLFMCMCMTCVLAHTMKPVGTFLPSKTHTHTHTKQTGQPIPPRHHEDPLHVPPPRHIGLLPPPPPQRLLPVRNRAWGIDIRTDS